MYRLLATTVLAGAGLLLARPALAQVVTFPSTTAGFLEQPANNWARLQTQAPATITVNLDGVTGSVFAVLQPVRIDAPSNAPTDTTRTTTVTFNGNTITNTGGSESVSGSRALPSGDTLLTVSMAVESGSPYPAGDYGYEVTITIAPD